ncbi:MAG TPA: hypothetical protein VE954_05095 [Oligoflexus sp.]|uniref:hypothetical protein n=1 Tax=Oligoflexus sp. TaxID=1971216 RepID=UPI002D286C17|nr:hypothetical protein [Oligoflexus sp.]HYX32468.1 hypothetical protein [Oligoflexus sp.]
MLQRFRIWYAFLGGAIAWTLHFMGSYAISEAFCRMHPAPLSLLGMNAMIWCLLLLTLVALAMAGIALWLSPRQHFASLTREGHHQGDLVHFMARTSLLSNGLFLLVIVAQAFPILVLGGNC